MPLTGFSVTVPLVIAARRVAMDTSFPVPVCCQAPPTFLGTSSQAHLLLMSLRKETVVLQRWGIGNKYLVLSTALIG